jgi:hypothetical protein
VSLFPKDDKQRKGLPIFKLITRYFPKALREVTKVSVANNVRYNPDRDPFDINWNRGKSTDQLGSLFRHIAEREVDATIYEYLKPEVAEVVGYDRVYVLAEAAWRALAALEVEIEQQESLGPATGLRDPNQPVPEGARLVKCSCGERVFTYKLGELLPRVVKDGVLHLVDGVCTSV